MLVIFRVKNTHTPHTKDPKKIVMGKKKKNNPCWCGIIVEEEVSCSFHETWTMKRGAVASAVLYIVSFFSTVQDRKMAKVKKLHLSVLGCSTDILFLFGRWKGYSKDGNRDRQFCSSCCSFWRGFRICTGYRYSTRWCHIPVRDERQRSVLFVLSIDRQPSLLFMRWNLEFGTNNVSRLGSRWWWWWWFTILL